MFLFLLSGLMTKELNNERAAWELYVTIYFHAYNKGAFSPKKYINSKNALTLI